MAHWHGYMAIENLNLTTAQRAEIITQLSRLGAISRKQPCWRNHRRTRNDGDAVLFEARFNDASLTIDAIKARLAGIFDVDVGTINHAVSTWYFDLATPESTPVVTFSRGGTDYLRFAVFGGIGSTWMQSGDEARGYLRTYSNEWDQALPGERELSERREDFNAGPG